MWRVVSVSCVWVCAPLRVFICVVGGGDGVRDVQQTHSIITALVRTLHRVALCSHYTFFRFAKVATSRGRTLGEESDLEIVEGTRGCRFVCVFV